LNVSAASLALAAKQLSLHEALRIQTARQVLARKVLTAHFQPLVELKSGMVMAHEGLIRGPANSPLHAPDALFRAARAEGLLIELEQACLVQVVQAWADCALDRRFFVNISAQVLVAMADKLSVAGVMRALEALGAAPSALVLEITEHERVADLPALISAAIELRALGLRFALDDFGDGRSSLRLWAELRPEIVKIDKYFIRELHSQAVKVRTLKGLARFAETFGTSLVAEGIETADELQALRDLGIDLGQGYFLGRPAAQPAKQISDAAAHIIHSAAIAVLPELKGAAGSDFTVERLLLRVPPLTPTATIDEVARLFAQDASLRAIALVDQGLTLGLVNRQSFVDRDAKP
jgi:EAL domain-containing protein (putative c-di-GMP-specific phosphodiesterase class I)